MRALFVANDGRSVGHVARALAVARAFTARGGEVVLATTSTADGLLAWGGVPTLRLPPFGALPEPERRALAARVLAGAVEGYRPDLLVVDTFPAGPHLEAWDALTAARRSVLIRRTVRPDRAGEPSVARGLEHHAAVVVPDDPVPQGLPDHPRTERVGPVVLDVDVLPRDAARRALGRPEGLSVLVSCGGRADVASEGLGLRVRHWCASRGHPAPVVVDGLLDSEPRPVPTPMARYLRAFDVVVASAGYNSANECAAVGVPTVLYGRERAFDDQLARAARFEAAGLGVALRSPDDLDHALERAAALRPPLLRCDGAAEAAAVLWSVGAA